MSDPEQERWHALTRKTVAACLWTTFGLSILCLAADPQHSAPCLILSLVGLAVSYQRTG